MFTSPYLFHFLIINSRNDEDPEIFVDSVNLIETLIQKLQLKQQELVSKNFTAEVEGLQRWIESLTARLLLEPAVLYSSLRDAVLFDFEIFNFAFNENGTEELNIQTILQKLTFWVILQENIVNGFIINPQDPGIWTFIRKLKFLTDINDVIFIRLQNYLNGWKIHQKKYQVESSFYGENGLRVITGFFHDFIGIVCDTRSHLNRLQAQIMGIGEQLRDAINQTEILFQALFNELIFFEIQPPQVLRTNTM